MNTEVRRFPTVFVSIAFLLIQAPLTCFATTEAPAKPVAAPVAEVADTKAKAPTAKSSFVMGLSETMKRNLSGLEFEKASDAQTVQKAREQAQEFIRFKRGRMSAAKKLQWLASCYKPSGKDNPFCEAAIERRSRRSSKPEEYDTRSQTPKHVADLLTRKDVSAFQRIRDGAITRAMKLISSWDRVKNISDEALSAKECPSVGLLTSLGQKAEEYFPEQKYRDLAIRHYARASECAGQDPAAEKARYRLAMLYLWNGDYAKADPVLQQLSEQKGGDYVSRALYWRGQCAKAVGDKLLFAALKGRLIKEYPLSYHGLLLSGGKSITASRTLSATEPLVRFRSQARPELNAALRGVELLQSEKEFGLSNDLLESIADRVEAAEMPVRLYVSLLMNRSGDRIGQFKMLSTIFRDDPAVISRASLEMFYPLKRFDVLRRHAANKVDPFLVAALIRQESGFNENARSRVGALGLMQIMPATARLMERVSRRELLDAKTNIRLGIRYFDGLISRFEGDAELALAAYNAGPEKVDDWKRRYPTDNRALFFDLIPYRETRDYVALIARNYYWYMNLYAEGENLGRTLASAATVPTATIAGTNAGRKPFVFTVFRPQDLANAHNTAID